MGVDAGCRRTRPCLGVLIDLTTAYPVLSQRRQGEWAVSSSIRVEFHNPVATETTSVTGKGTFDHRNEKWGHSLGTLASADGVLLATASQRMHYIPGSDELHRRSPTIPVPSWLRHLDGSEMSRAEETVTETNQADQGGLLFDVASDERMTNPLGSLHGGVALALHVRAAREAVAQVRDDVFRPAAVDVTYFRPADVAAGLRVETEIMGSTSSVAMVISRCLDSRGKLVNVGVCTLHRAETDRPLEG